jgi:hypothetical protein
MIVFAADCLNVSSVPNNLKQDSSAQGVFKVKEFLHLMLWSNSIHSLAFGDYNLTHWTSLLNEFSLFAR